MPKFEYEQLAELPDRAYVRVESKYDVTIIRTEEGLIIDVYPLEWDAPIETMTIWDDELAAMEAEIAEGD